jgi:hypothetical protein
MYRGEYAGEMRARTRAGGHLSKDSPFRTRTAGTSAVSLAPRHGLLLTAFSRVAAELFATDRPSEESVAT